MNKIAPALALSVMLFTLSFRPAPLAGEERSPLITVKPFTSSGLGMEESYLIESLIRSYLSDFGEITGNYGLSLFAGGPGPPDTPEPDSDYVFSGNISLQDGSRVFTLEVARPATGEVSSFTSVHRSTGELVLKARSLVESIFSSGTGKPGQEAVMEAMNEQIIAGYWRGEEGIELIRLYQGGRGTALFSSGVQMALFYTIEDNILRVFQDSPNSERFYYPLPHEAARQLAAAAGPMRWEMSLWERGAVLRGTRTGPSAVYEGEKLLELVSDFVLNVEWLRSR